MIGRLSREEMRTVLSENHLGRVACHDGDDIYMVPVNYVFDKDCILCHSVKGKKTRLMKENPSVCFQVDELRSFTDWKSVIAWGHYEEITDERERMHAMQLFVEKTLRLKISETAVLPELTAERTHPRSPGNIRPVLWRIRVERMTGRFETMES